MAASCAGTLLRCFKRGREDEERKDEENANTGDSQPTRAKKGKKDRDFKTAWKKDFVWFNIVYNDTEGKMFCQYCVNSPNSKNENPSSRKGSNKYFLIAKETQDKRYTL